MPKVVIEKADGTKQVLDVTDAQFEQMRRDQGLEAGDDYTVDNNLIKDLQASSTVTTVSTDPIKPRPTTKKTPTQDAVLKAAEIAGKLNLSQFNSPLMNPAARITANLVDASKSVVTSGLIGLTQMGVSAVNATHNNGIQGLAEWGLGTTASILSGATENLAKGIGMASAGIEYMLGFEDNKGKSYDEIYGQYKKEIDKEVQPNPEGWFAKWQDKNTTEVLKSDWQKTLNQAQELAKFELPTPEGYENASPSEFLNPFSSAGYKFYTEGLAQAAGFMVPTIIGTKAAVATGEVVGKLAAKAVNKAETQVAKRVFKDIMDVGSATDRLAKQTARVETMANAGQKIGYVSGSLLSSQYEANIEGIGGYKEVYDKLYPQFLEQLKGMPQEQAEAEAHKQADAIAMDTGKDIINGNLGLLALMNMYELDLFGAGVKKKVTDNIMDQIELYSKKNLVKNIQSAGRIGLGVASESFQEAYQGGLGLYEKNQISPLTTYDKELARINNEDDTIGSLFTEGLQGAVEGLKKGDMEVLGGAVLGGLIGGGFTGIAESGARSSNKKYIENAYKHFGQDRNNTMLFNIQESEDIRGVLSTKNTLEPLRLTLAGNKLKTDFNKRIAADIKYSDNDQRDPLIDHLSDLAEDDHLTNILFDEIEKSKNKRPDQVSEHLLTVLGDHYKTSNKEFIYKGEPTNIGTLLANKHQMLINAQSTYDLATNISKEMKANTVFKRAIYDVLNQRNHHIMYRDLIQAKLNAIPVDEQVLIDKPEYVAEKIKYEQQLDYFNQLIEKSKNDYKELLSTEQVVNHNSVQAVIEAILENPQEAEKLIIENPEISETEKVKATEILSGITVDKRIVERNIQKAYDIADYNEFDTTIKDIIDQEGGDNQMYEAAHSEYERRARIKEKNKKGSDIFTDKGYLREYDLDYKFLVDRDVKAFNTWAAKHQELIPSIYTYFNNPEEFIAKKENGAETVRVKTRQDISRFLGVARARVNDVDTPAQIIAPWIAEHFKEYSDSQLDFPSNENRDSFEQQVVGIVDPAVEQEITEDEPPFVTLEIENNKQQNEIVRELLIEPIFLPKVEGLEYSSPYIDSRYYTDNNKDRLKFDHFIPFGYELDPNFDIPASPEFISYLETLPNWEILKPEAKKIYGSKTYENFIQNWQDLKNYHNKNINDLDNGVRTELKYEVDVRSSRAVSILAKSKLSNASVPNAPVLSYIEDNGKKIYVGVLRLNNKSSSNNIYLQRLANAYYVNSYKGLNNIQQPDLDTLQTVIDKVPNKVPYSPKDVSFELPIKANIVLKIPVAKSFTVIPNSEYGITEILKLMEHINVTGLYLSYNYMGNLYYASTNKYKDSKVLENLYKIIDYLQANKNDIYMLSMEIARLSQYSAYTFDSQGFKKKDDPNTIYTIETLKALLAEDAFLYQNIGESYLPLEIGSNWKKSRSANAYSKDLYNKYLIDNGLLNLGRKIEGIVQIPDVLKNGSYVEIQSLGSTTNDTGLVDDNNIPTGYNFDNIDFKIDNDQLPPVDNVEAQKQWMSERFPEIGLEVSKTDLDSLYRGSLLGQKVWGAYRNGLVQLAKGAGDPILYHESFHVVEDIYLTEAEKRKVYEEARQRWFADTITAMDLDALDMYENHPILTQISEKLADYSSEYLTGVKSIEPKGVIEIFLQKLIDFIWRIPKYYINSFLERKSIDDILFAVDRNILTKNVFGVQSTKIKDTIIKNLNRVGVDYKFHVESWTERKTKQEIDFVNKTVIYDILATEMVPVQRYNENTEKWEYDRLEWKNVDNFSEYLKYLKSENSQVEDIYDYFYTNVIPQRIRDWYPGLFESDISKLERHFKIKSENPELNIPINKRDAYIFRAINNALNLKKEYEDLFEVLKQEGFQERLKVDLALTHSHRSPKKFKVIEDLEQDVDSIFENDGEIEEDDNEGEETQEQTIIYGKKKNIDPKKFLTGFLKYVINSIPKIKNVNSKKEIEYITGPRGSFHREYVQGDERYYQILEVISESLSKEDIKVKLEQQASKFPWIYALLEKLPNGQSDTDARKQRIMDELWSKIASFKFQTYGSLAATKEDSKVFIVNESKAGQALYNDWTRGWNNSQLKSVLDTLNAGQSAVVFNKKIKDTKELRTVLNNRVDELKAKLTQINVQTTPHQIRSTLSSIVSLYNMLGSKLTYDAVKQFKGVDFVSYLHTLIGTSNPGMRTGLYLYVNNLESFDKGKIPTYQGKEDPAFKLLTKFLPDTKLFQYVNYEGSHITSYIAPNNLTQLFRILDHPKYGKQFLELEQTLNSINLQHNVLAEDMKRLSKRELIHNVVSINEDRVNETSTDKLFDGKFYNFIYKAFNSLRGEGRAYVFLGTKSDNTQHWFANTKLLNISEAQSHLKLLIWNELKTKAILEDSSQDLKNKGLDLSFKNRAYNIPETISKQLKLYFKLNTKESSEYIDTVFTKVGLDQWYNDYILQEEYKLFKLLIENGVISKSDVNVFKYYDTLKSKVGDVQDINDFILEVEDTAIPEINTVNKIRETLWNSMFYQNAMNQIQHGDMSFYKTHENLVKRAHQDTKPGINHFEYNPDEMFRILNIKDIIVSSSPEIIAALKNLHGEDSEFVKDFESNNTTDSWKWHTLNYRKDFENSRVNWTPMMDAIYNTHYVDKNGSEILTGYVRPLDTREVFQNLKLHTTEMRSISLKTNNGIIYDMNIPIQEKPLENVLLRTFAYKLKDVNVWAKPEYIGDKESFFKILQSKYEYPKLAYLLYVMETHNIDAATFGAFKTGGLYPIDLETDDTLLDNASAKVNYIKKHWVKEQTEMPNKHIGVNNTEGTQQRNIIMANIRPLLTYDFPKSLYLDLGNGSQQYDNIKGTQLIHLFNILDQYDLQDGINKATEDSSKQNVIALVKDNILSGLISSDLWDQALLKNGNFKLGLWHPLWGNRIFSAISSIFENKFNKTKTPKGYAASNFGLANRLQLNTVDINGKTLPGKMNFGAPIWSMALQKYAIDQISAKKARDVNSVIEKLLSNPDTADFLTGLFYRIPTESNYSIVEVQYKEYIPEALGSIVANASEIFNITGADADGDVFSSLMPILEYKNGVLSMVEPGISSKESRHNLRVFLSRMVVDTEDFKKTQFKTGGPGVLDDLAKKYREAVNYYSIADQWKMQSEIHKSLGGISINAASLSLDAKLSNQLKFVAGLNKGLTLSSPIGLDQVYNNMNGTYEGLQMRGPLVAKHTDAIKNPLDLSALGLNNITQPIASLIFSLSNDNNAYLDNYEYLVEFFKQPIIDGYVQYLIKANYYNQDKESNKYFSFYKNVLEQLYDKAGFDDYKKGSRIKTIYNVGIPYTVEDLAKFRKTKLKHSFQEILRGSNSSEILKSIDYLELQLSMLSKFRFLENINQPIRDITMYLRDDQKRNSDTPIKLIRQIQKLKRAWDLINRGSGRTKNHMNVNGFDKILPQIGVNSQGNFSFLNYEILNKSFEGSSDGLKPKVFQRLLHNTHLKVLKLNKMSEMFPYLNAKYVVDIFDNLGLMYGPQGNVITSQVKEFTTQAINLMTATAYSKKLAMKGLTAEDNWRRLFYDLYVVQKLLIDIPTVIDRNTYQLYPEINKEIKDELEKQLELDPAYYQKLIAAYDNYVEIFRMFNYDGQALVGSNLFPIKITGRYANNHEYERLQNLFYKGLNDGTLIPGSLYHKKSRTFPISEIFDELKTYAYMNQGVNYSPGHIARLIPKAVIAEDTMFIDYDNQFWKYPETFVPQVLDFLARKYTPGFSQRIFRNNKDKKLDDIQKIIESVKIHEDSAKLIISFVMKPKVREGNNQIYSPQYVRYYNEQLGIDGIYKQDPEVPNVYYIVALKDLWEEGGNYGVTGEANWQHFDWLAEGIKEDKLLSSSFPYESNPVYRRDGYADFMQTIGDPDERSLYEQVITRLRPSKSNNPRPLQLNPRSSTVMGTLASPSMPVITGELNVDIEKDLQKNNIVTLNRNTPLSSVPAIPEQLPLKMNYKGTVVLVKYLNKIVKEKVEKNQFMEELIEKIKEGQGAIIFGISTAGKTSFVKAAPDYLKDRVIDLDLEVIKIMQSKGIDVNISNYGSIFGKTYRENKVLYDQIVEEMILKAQELKQEGFVVFTPNRNFLNKTITDIALITRDTERLINYTDAEDRENRYKVTKDYADKLLTDIEQTTTENKIPVVDLKSYNFIGDLFKATDESIYVADNEVFKRRLSNDMVAKMLNVSQDNISVEFKGNQPIYRYAVQRAQSTALIPGQTVIGTTEVTPIKVQPEVLTTEMTLFRLEEQGSKYSLESSNDRYYKDINGKFYNRIGNIAHGLHKDVPQDVYDKYQLSMNVLKDNFAIGQVFDKLLKDLLEGKELNVDNYIHPLISSQAIQAIIDDQQAIKDHINNIGESILGPGFKIVTDIKPVRVLLNSVIDAVGTPDVYLVKDNKVIIIDIKSSSMPEKLINLGSKVGSAYIVSQNMYKVGLEQLNLEVPGVYLLPIQVVKDSDGNVIMSYTQLLQTIPSVPISELGITPFMKSMSLEDIINNSFENNKKLLSKCKSAR